MTTRPSYHIGGEPNAFEAPDASSLPEIEGSSGDEASNVLCHHGTRAFHSRLDRISEAEPPRQS